MVVNCADEDLHSARPGWAVSVKTGGSGDTGIGDDSQTDRALGVPGAELGRRPAPSVTWRLGTNIAALQCC